MKYNKILMMTVAIMGIAVFSMLGCEDVDPDAVSSEDSTAAILAVNTANAALEDLMSDMVNAEPGEAQEMMDLLDFGVPYGYYVNAHELDHRNNDANFGLALTGFVMLSQDPDLQDMILSWESYFDVNEPFLVEGSQGTMGKHGFGLPLSLDGMRLPLAPFIEAPMAMAKMSIDDVPQFSQFQGLVDSLFLPVIESSLEALDAIDDSTDYVFIVSPAMQGEPESDPIEIDLTEIFALEMGLYGLKSVLNTVVAYNFDFVSFDSVGIVTELAQDSDFATLKSNGGERLALAYAAADSAIAKALAAIDFLEGETDDQSDDLIFADEDFDLDEIQGYINDANDALIGPTVFNYTYVEEVLLGEQWYELEVEDSITVDISQFFLNPIQDFKQKLPTYTMRVNRYNEYQDEYTQTAVDIEYASSIVDISELSNEPITILLDYDSEADLMINARVFFKGFYIPLATASPAEIPQSIIDLYLDFMELVNLYSSDLYGYSTIEFEWAGVVTTGESLEVTGSYQLEYKSRIASYYIPDPVWVATDYDTWINAWPDATMNGILPEMDAGGLIEFLDITEDDWNDF